MPRRKKQATSEEVLKYLSSVMRGEAAEPPASRLVAADRLGRYFGLWDGRGWAGAYSGLKPLPRIYGEEDLV